MSGCSRWECYGHMRCFPFLVCWARGVFAAMENPVNIFFCMFPPVALASRLVNGYYQTTPRCAVCSQPLGQRWL